MAGSTDHRGISLDISASLPGARQRPRLRTYTGDDDLEIVQTWDNGKFEEIDLDHWVRSSPNYLLANNFPGIPESAIAKMKQT